MQWTFASILSMLSPTPPRCFSSSPATLAFLAAIFRFPSSASWPAAALVFCTESLISCWLLLWKSPIYLEITWCIHVFRCGSSSVDRFACAAHSWDRRFSLEALPLLIEAPIRLSLAIRSAPSPSPSPALFFFPKAQFALVPMLKNSRIISKCQNVADGLRIRLLSRIFYLLSHHIPLSTSFIMFLAENFPLQFERCKKEEISESLFFITPSENCCRNRYTVLESVWLI